MPRMYGQFFLMLRLALVLTQFCSVLGTTDSLASDLSPRTVYACEGHSVKIQCANGLQIHVIRSNYGRLSLLICNDKQSTEGWNLTCASTKAMRIVSNECNHQKERCQIVADSKRFGDPCHLTPKYLEVQYRCLPGVTTTAWTSAYETLRRTRFHQTSLATSEVAFFRTGDNFLLLATSFPYSHDGLNSEFCEATFSRSIAWPRSWPGQTVMVDCPNNHAVKKAFWHCGVSPVEWVNRPDLSLCISPTVGGSLHLISENEEPFVDRVVELVATDITIFTDFKEQIFGGDLLNIVAIMQKLVNQTDHHLQQKGSDVAKDLILKVNQAIIETSSNLLHDLRIESWYDIPQSKWSSLSTLLLSAIEKSAHQVALITTKPAILRNVETNIVVEIRIINTTGPISDQVFLPVDSIPSNSDEWMSDGNSITLTGETVREFGVAGLSKMVFAAYNNIEKWLQNKGTSVEIDLKNPSTNLDASDVDLGSGLLSGLNSTHVEPREDLGSVLPSEKEIKNMTENLGNKTVNTRIISAAFINEKLQRVMLKEPVVFMMKHITLTSLSPSHPSCSFWEYSKSNLRGYWSTEGCILLSSNVTHTQCSCNHLTNFAVLMTVHNHKLTDVQKFSLSFITYAGCILSIICLGIAFVTFQFFKNLQCDRNTIHKNLVAVMGVAEITFLIGIVQYETPVLCAIIAGLLHYLFLVTFMWMCLEGIQLYVMLVEVFEAEKSRVKWYYLCAYGIPAIIVIISSIIGHEGYGTSSHCWLSPEKGFIWAFVGPVCLIICINFVMLTIAMYVMCTHASNVVNVWKAKQKTTFENIRSWIKGAVVLVVLLGLTWTFGLFYINEQSLIMAYIFTVLNSIQGVFIFVFHCLMNEKVQKEYKRWVRHTEWFPEALRVRCGGVRTSVSVTPVHSSSSGANKPLQEKNPLEKFSKLFRRNTERKRSSTSTLPSSSNNNIKREYNRISGQPSDSRSVFCDNEVSQMNSEPTEDPYSYLETGRREFSANEEFYLAAGDISMMEGSVADTDYLEDYCLRASNFIDFDKYKIRNQDISKKGVLEALQSRLAGYGNGNITQPISDRRNNKESDQTTGQMSSTTLVLPLTVHYPKGNIVLR